MEFKKYFIIGLILRLILVMYSKYHDANFELKYSDIDYKVFTDAAMYVLNGKSPYERLTYRYTPLLAYALIPNYWFPEWGKVLFSIADMMVVLLIYKILKHQKTEEPRAKFMANLWNFCPLAWNICSRGNADSIVPMLVLSSLLLVIKGRYKWAGFIFGLAVHFKIYPVIYALTFYLALDSHQDKNSKHGIRAFYKNFFTKERLWFSFTALKGCFGLINIFNLIYGEKFFYETYQYHLIRTDNRHNFSVYFYVLYIFYGTGISKLVGLLAFIPQWILILSSGFLFHLDILFALFLQTIIFVMFNKVCTAQYFVWYVCLMPLFMNKNKYFMSKKWWVGFGSCGIWTVTELFWNYNGYQLEIKGENQFLGVWLAGILFFLANVFILTVICKGQQLQPTIYTYREEAIKVEVKESDEVHTTDDKQEGVEMTKRVDSVDK